MIIQKVLLGIYLITGSRLNHCISAYFHSRIFEQQPIVASPIFHRLKYVWLSRFFRLASIGVDAEDWSSSGCCPFLCITVQPIGLTIQFARQQLLLPIQYSNLPSSRVVRLRKLLYALCRDPLHCHSRCSCMFGLQIFLFVTILVLLR